MDNQIVRSPQKALAYITEKFSYLTTFGFDFAKARIHESSMGWILELHSTSGIGLKIGCDRGGLYITFSPSASSNRSWFGLEILIYYLSARKITKTTLKPEYIGKDIQFEILAVLLFQYIMQIMELITSERYQDVDMKRYLNEFLEYQLNGGDIYFE